MHERTLGMNKGDSMADRFKIIRTQTCCILDRVVRTLIVATDTPDRAEFLLATFQAVRPQWALTIEVSPAL